MDTLTSMRVFRLAVELKSFAAAARRLDMSPAMASKHVMHLERRLGALLLNRTSRHLSLTESGATYFDHVRQWLDELDDVEAAVAQSTASPIVREFSIAIATGPRKSSPCCAAIRSPKSFPSWTK